MQRDYAELEIKSTPYRDLISKEYPIIVKMQRNECTFEDLDQEDMVIVGDVDHCLRKVERYQKAGLDHFIALMQADRIPHDKVMRSIELFAKEIIPRFRQNRARVAASKPVVGATCAGARIDRGGLRLMSSRRNEERLAPMLLPRSVTCRRRDPTRGDG